MLHQITTCDTASDNEWQRVTTTDNKWQRVTAKYNEWQQNVWGQEKINENEPA